MRREISRTWLSFMAAGAVRSALSIDITTSAWLRAGRLPEPAKITASMSAARSDLCEVSPIAQRSASTRLDLPQPFGPTTPVRPGWIMKSVGSTNDLKPWRRRRVSFMNTNLAWPGANLPAVTIPWKAMSVCGRTALAALIAQTMARPGPEGNGPRRLFPRVLQGFCPVFCWTYGIARISGRESAFQQRVDTPSEFLEGGFTHDFVAVDEKGRRALDLQDVLGIFLTGADLVLHRLVLQAVLDRLRAQSRLPPDQPQRVGGFLHQLVLLAEHDVDHGEIFCGVLTGDAACQHRAGEILDVERELAEHVPHLAGVDEFRLEFWKHVLVERGAMRAGRRRVFDDRHLGVIRTERHVGQRLRLGHLAGRHRQRPGGQCGQRQGGSEGAAGDEQGGLPSVKRSALQQCIDALAELVEGLFALEHLAVDEEGRCRIDLQHLGGEFLVGRDLVEQRLILQTIFHRLLGE